MHGTHGMVDALARLASIATRQGKAPAMQIRATLIAASAVTSIGVTGCGGGGSGPGSSGATTPPVSSPPTSSTAATGAAALPTNTCTLLTAEQVKRLLGAPGGPGTSSNQGTTSARCTFGANVNGGANLVQLDVQVGVTGDYFQSQPSGSVVNGVGDKAYYQAAPDSTGSYHFNALAAQKGSVVVRLDAGGPLTASQALPVLSADITAIFSQLGA